MLLCHHVLDIIISIHSAARAETTATSMTGHGYWKISIHSAARAETHWGCKPSTDRHRFQSTPPRGRRHLSLTVPPIFPLFQSTPPRGRRQAVIVPRQLEAYISIHSAARAET